MGVKGGGGDGLVAALDHIPTTRPSTNKNDPIGLENVEGTSHDEGMFCDVWCYLQRVQWNVRRDATAFRKADVLLLSDTCGLTGFRP